MRLLASYDLRGLLQFIVVSVVDIMPPPVARRVPVLGPAVVTPQHLRAVAHMVGMRPVVVGKGWRLWAGLSCRCEVNRRIRLVATTAETAEHGAGEPTFAGFVHAAAVSLLASPCPEHRTTDIAARQLRYRAVAPATGCQLLTALEGGAA